MENFLVISVLGRGVNLGLSEKLPIFDDSKKIFLLVNSKSKTVNCSERPYFNVLKQNLAYSMEYFLVISVLVRGINFGLLKKYPFLMLRKIIFYQSLTKLKPSSITNSLIFLV